MINKSRYLDILLFYVKTPIIIKNYTIEPGWNQLVRKEKQYFITKLGQNSFYLEFPVSLGHLLIENTFGELNN